MTDQATSLHDSTGTQAPFSFIRQYVVAHLMDNFSRTDLDHLEGRLLNTLYDNRGLRGVIFNFSEVITTDPQDLRHLERIFTAIQLVGGRVGLCGINPGVAVLIVHAGLNFQRQIIGFDMDELVARL